MLADAFRRAVPDAPKPAGTGGSLRGYSAFFDRAADGMRRAGAFNEPERWRVDWECAYTRDGCLDLLATGGGLNRLDAAHLDAVLADVGTAIDSLGASFTMRYATVVVTAARTAAT